MSAKTETAGSSLKPEMGRVNIEIQEEQLNLSEAFNALAIESNNVIVRRKPGVNAWFAFAASGEELRQFKFGVMRGVRFRFVSVITPDIVSSDDIAHRWVLVGELVSEDDTQFSDEAISSTTHSVIFSLPHFSFLAFPKKSSFEEKQEEGDTGGSTLEAEEFTPGALVYEARVLGLGPGGQMYARL